MTTLVTWSKGHVWEPLTLSQQLPKWAVDAFSPAGDMYFVCHVTLQNHSVEMSCIFMGENFSQHVTTLKLWWPWTF